MARGLVAAFLIAAAFFYGFVANERHLPPAGLARSVYGKLREARRAMAPREGDRPDGRWRRAGGGAVAGDVSDAVERLESLGYAAGTQTAEGAGGILVHDPDLAWEGINLVVSGHGPDALLLDMDGNEMHRWSRDYWSAFPDTDVPRDREPAQFWRFARLLDGGDLLAIYEGNGLVRIDRNSNVVWAFDGRAHHDLDVDERGNIWVLTRKIRFLRRIHPEKPVLEDFVTVLASDGTVLREISVLEAFERSDYASLMEGMPAAGDIFHTNALEILDGSQVGRLPAFRHGNLLISVHTLNVIAVLDPDEGRIVWALSGMWKRQHDPRQLANGNLLLFDNQGNHGMSKVIEFDPLTQRIAWSFDGTAENGFYTELCGASQRLPNGNTLITESESGRAFEVTPGGAVVWRYDSPFRAGKQGELVATLLEVVRLPADTPLEWMAGG